MKIFDEIQVLQRRRPPQTKSAYLLDISISPDLKNNFLSLSVVYSIALNTLIQFDIPLSPPIQLRLQIQLLCSPGEY